MHLNQKDHNLSEAFVILSHQLDALHHVLRTLWAPYDPSKGALASFICTGVRRWAAGQVGPGRPDVWQLEVMLAWFVEMPKFWIYSVFLHQGHPCVYGQLFKMFKNAANSDAFRDRGRENAANSRFFAAVIFQFKRFFVWFYNVFQTNLF